MDLITFQQLADQHKKSLEARMRKARVVRNNLTRMVEESITEINRRAEQDKEEISKIFTTLISHQEQEIALLREEMGIGKEKSNEGILAGNDAEKVNEQKPVIVMPPRLTPGVKKRT